MRISYLPVLFLIVSAACRQEVSEMEKILDQTARTSFFVPENPYASRVRVRYFDSLLQHVSEYERMPLK
ncbi:MAG: hypothetical protein ACLFT3_20835, partial [Cyclobacteriaceae bacterium]